MFESGVKENVLPVRASAVANFRIHPRDRVEDVVDHVRRVVDDDRVRLELALRTPPRNPSAVSPVGAESFVALRRTIRSVFPDAIVVPYLVPGGTDSRHFGPICDNIYRFLPFEMGAEAVELAHGTDEHILGMNLINGVLFYRQLLLDSVAQAPSGAAQPSSE